jgi:hypothetical protein
LRINLNKIIQISLGIILITSIFQISPFQTDLVHKVAAQSNWIETNWSTNASYSEIFDLDTISPVGEVKLDHGPFVFVADTYNHRIIKTRMDGTGWTSLGTKGSGVGQFDNPFGISYDSTTGFIYVADYWNHRIVKTKIDGSGWTTYGTVGNSGVGKFNLPRGISYDSNTAYVYVAEWHNSRIIRTKMDGTGWATLGTEGNGTLEFYGPCGVSPDTNTGFIYVADTLNDRIVKTRMDGSGWTTYGTSGNGVGHFDIPWGISYDNNTGYIYIGDAQHSYIVKTKMDGSGWTILSGMNFNGPTGLNYDVKTGYIYTADNYRNRIVKTKIDGSGWKDLGTQGSGIGQFDTPFDVDFGKGYCPEGYLISKYYDCGASTTNFKTLNWTAATPSCTSIRFQIRSASSSAGLELQDFSGPDGNTDSYYTVSGTEIWDDHDGDQWLQYKVYLKTTDNSVTPALKEVNITYNILPNTPTLIAPGNDIWINNSRPNFIWNFNDIDSGFQGGFRLQIDDDISFKSIDYDSNEVASTMQSFIPGLPIEDGVWYWRVKTQDSDGDWGPYCSSWILKIDVTPPNSFIPLADPNDWASNNQSQISFSTIDATSGIDHYDLFTENATISDVTSPFILPLQSDGIHNITVRAYDKAGNYIDGCVDIYVDATPPLEFAPVADPNDWTSNSQPNILYTTSDETSGIDHYEVKIDEGDFFSQASPYTLPPQNDGSHTITISAIDLAGNYRNGSVNVYIDTTPPNEFAAIVEQTSWTSDNQPKVSYSTTDDTSGIDHYEVMVDAGSFLVQDSPYILPDQLDGIHTVKVRAYDLAQNYRDANVEIFIDTTSPDIRHDPVIKVKERMEIVINAIVLDENSGVENVTLHFKKKVEDRYSSIIMNGINNTYSATISAEIVTSDLEYYIEAYDRSSPFNIAYYGINGLTEIRPSSATDIDIIIEHKGGDGDNNGSGGIVDSGGGGNESSVDENNEDGIGDNDQEKIDDKDETSNLLLLLSLTIIIIIIIFVAIILVFMVMHNKNKLINKVPPQPTPTPQVEQPPHPQPQVTPPQEPPVTEQPAEPQVQPQEQTQVPKVEDPEE